MSGTIEVDDIQEMYRFIRKKRCDCGGKYQITKHRKIGKNSDFVSVQCINCTKSAGFVFKLER